MNIWLIAFPIVTGIVIGICALFFIRHASKFATAERQAAEAEFQKLPQPADQHPDLLDENKPSDASQK